MSHGLCPLSGPARGHQSTLSLSLRGPEAHTSVYYGGELTSAQLERREREQSEPHSYTLQYHSMVTQRSSTIVNQSLASFTYRLSKITSHTIKDWRDNLARISQWNSVATEGLKITLVVQKLFLWLKLSNLGMANLNQRILCMHI